MRALYVAPTRITGWIWGIFFAKDGLGSGLVLLQLGGLDLSPKFRPVKGSSYEY